MIRGDTVHSTSEAKVSDLDNSIGGEQNVLRLDVAVNNVRGVQIGNAAEELSGNTKCVLLVDTVLATRKEVEEGTVGHVLHDDVQVRGCFEDVKGANNVGVRD